MKNTIKMASAAVYMALGLTCAGATAIPTLPPIDQECINAGMRDYCKASGQRDNCLVPTEVYYRIVANCV